MKNDNKIKKDNKQQCRINEQIRVSEVRIVDDNGSSVMPTRQALDLARQQGVDLVEISPNAVPPVCRIIDYSKYLYQQKKRAKEMKAKQVKVEVKEYLHTIRSHRMHQLSCSDEQGNSIKYIKKALSLRYGKKVILDKGV